MKNVLLFCDPGIDDSIAIMYALLHPDINLVGVVSGYGNVDKKQATNNVAYLMDLANQKGIPIIGGATRSCTGEAPIYYPEIHGEDGLGPIRPPDTIKGELLNFSEVFKVIERHSDVFVVDVGRNTSLAVAMILDNEFQKKVKGFYVMGGAFLVPGNVTEAAEANFYGDPIASNFVMSEIDNVYSVPLNVTNKAIVKHEHILAIQDQSSSALISILDEVYDYYYEAYKKLVPGIQGAPLHDVVSLSLLMNPGMGQFLTRRVSVQSIGAARGQSLANFRVGSEAPIEGEEDLTKANIYLSLDYDAFIKDFIKIMSKQS
ncbi:nucleoside hydrolase [Rossellomorea aquimaris]|uniref:nucleoside hydrolase n=1 Tax=Rossellomorea aquimaris TaxID=189382 RepID=UPI001CD19F3F|nr:nucleoside hydrolase [Rossellomorea aquimaris]MCA1056692.1 nucleoside hydrolase [Rossellomorea aquimaris]